MVLWIEPPPRGSHGVSFCLHEEGRSPKLILLRDAYATLKELAVSGNLYFNKTKLSCDLFSSVKLAYTVHKTTADLWLIQAVALLRQQEIPLETVDWIGQGPPHWLIRGPILKFLDPEIQWKWLKEFRGKQFFATHEQKELFLKENKAHCLFYEEEKHERFPVLIIDHTGGFANLVLKDARNVRTPFANAKLEEAIWESDLLETSFTKKPVGTTQYYCPLDQVHKSLIFLLECGWHIEDNQGRRLYLPRAHTYEVVEEKTQVHLKGKVDYEAGAASFGKIAASMRRKETFVSLTPDAIGIMPELALPLEGELTQEGIALKKNRFGLLKEWGLTLEPAPYTVREHFFHGTLRPYQQAGVDWLAFLHSRGFHGLLADEMGLGKTVQVLAFLAHLPRALIIMPTTLLFNWRCEIKRFVPQASVYVHHGVERQRELPMEGFILTSYGTLLRDLALFQSQYFHAIVLDEAQVIKNPESQTAQAVCTLQGQLRLSMTGTPVENSRLDLWSQFRFLMPDLFSDWNTFMQEDLQVIRRTVLPFFLRRRKEEVAPDLPEKIEQIVWIEMEKEQLALYNRYIHDAKQGLLKKVGLEGVRAHRMEILELLLRLRQITCHPRLLGQTEGSAKWDAFFNDLESMLAEKRKILVYSQFTSILSLMEQEMSKLGWQTLMLEGKTHNREEVITTFCQSEDIQILLMSLKAGGVGLNLAVADVVMLYDPWWNDAIEAQAIARAHRIGRTGTVLAKRYITVGSVEEKMVQLKKEKNQLADTIFDQKSLSDADLTFLLS